MTLDGFFARVGAFWHIARGHDVDWAVDTSDLCDGDIVCETCHVVLWCRYHDLSNYEKALRHIEATAPTSARAEARPGVQGQDEPTVA